MTTTGRGEATGAVVAIGNFDGVHRGHQELLRIAAATAAEAGRRCGVVTFAPHPRKFFRPDEPFFTLTPGPVKARLMAACGMDFMTTLTFDRELSGMEPGEFVRAILVERLQVSHVVTGYDFHFGKGRKGNPSTMRELGDAFGFGVSIVEQVGDDDDAAPFSSSSIRTRLRHGHVIEAAGELGYWWFVTGKVIDGDKRGRDLGFPTANIELEDGCEPADGIYAMRVRVIGDAPDTVLHGAGYIGRRPTFEGERRFLEIYLLGFDGDLYGRELMIEFNAYIRPDMRFDGAEDLARQIDADCAAVTSRLEELSHDDPLAGLPLAEAQKAGRL